MISAIYHQHTARRQESQFTQSHTTVWRVIGASITRFRSRGKYWQSINFFSMWWKWHEKSIMIIKSSFSWELINEIRISHWRPPSEFLYLLSVGLAGDSARYQCFAFYRSSKCDGGWKRLGIGSWNVYRWNYQRGNKIKTTGADNIDQVSIILRTLFIPIFSLAVIKHSLLFNPSFLFSYPVSA